MAQRPTQTLFGFVTDGQPKPEVMPSLHTYHFFSLKKNPTDRRLGESKQTSAEETRGNGEGLGGGGGGGGLLPIVDHTGRLRLEEVPFQALGIQLFQLTLSD